MGFFERQMIFAYNGRCKNYSMQMIGAEDEETAQ